MLLPIFVAPFSGKATNTMAVKREGALIFIFITVLADVIGIGIIIPLIPALIQKLSGEGISEAARYGGWLQFAFAGMQFIFAPVLGGLSDRYGRRPILLLSLFGLGLDYVFMAFAPAIWLLFVGRIIGGIFGASFTTASAYIADISPPEKLSQNFGLIGGAFGLGFIIGPVIGGFTGQYGLHIPFLVSAGISLANMLYGYFILPESLKPENRRPFEWKRANPFGSLLHLRKYPAVTGMVISLMLLNIGGEALPISWSYYTIFKFAWDEKTIGLSLAAVGIMVALVQGLLIRLATARFKDMDIIRYGLFLSAAGMVLFALATRSWMMFAVLVPYCLGNMCYPVLQGYISKDVPANAQGELQGVLTSLLSLAAIISPVIMTGLFTYFTEPWAPFLFPGAPFMAGGLLFLLSLGYTWFWKKHVPAVAESPALVAE